MLQLEKQGYQTLKQIAFNCGKKSVSSGKLFCKLNNIIPDYSYPFSKGTIEYYSPEKSFLIGEFVRKDNNRIKNIKRNPLLNGKSITELQKKYGISSKTVKKYNLTTEEDFINYVNIPLSPVTICKKNGIRISIFRTWNPGIEPTEENIKNFAEVYKKLSLDEKKHHKAQLQSDWNKSLAGLQAKKKAKCAIDSLSEFEKKESVRKCKEAKEKNGTLGWNAQCKYLYNGKGYNKTELSVQLEHPDWVRIDKAVFQYEINNKKYDYVPDFYDTYNKQYIEIKGQNFFDEQGKFIDPYNQNRLKKKLITSDEYCDFQKKADAKYQCMVENNVKIIIDSSKEIKDIIKKYSKECERYRIKSATYIKSVRKGVKLTNEERISLSKKHTKPFICINTGKIYTSLRECADELNIKSVTSITNVCTGKNKKTKNGYVFRYVDN